ncbi:cytokinesis protein 3 [Agyrium rufum]|nr:cytokinesis protein 3 [Agyrium rufum]
MADIAPNLPMKFPCWCRAVYSWGGETKKDLGFMEGDLIECLNAGDGSWWMGRLQRDRRMMGLFPSNFVEVLKQNPIPRSRSASPIPGENKLGNSRAPSPAPPPQKKSFPKPFQSYGKPPPSTSASRGPSPNPSRQNSYRSNNESTFLHDSNAAYASRQPSPVTFGRNHSMWKDQYPEQNQDVESSPAPPPPPPHRVAYNPQQHPPRATPSPVPSMNHAYPTLSRGPSPSPSMNDRYPTVSRGHSPVPPSPGVHGHTPSPLRDAMEDVMSSLHHMALRRDEPSPVEDAPIDPWSPEAFEELRIKPRKKQHARSNTAIGIEDDYGADSGYHSQERSTYGPQDGEPPQLTSYVQRMEAHLRNAQRQAPIEDSEMGPPPPPKSVAHPMPLSPPSQRGGTMERHPSDQERKLRNRKSAYELGKGMIGRTFTTKTNSSTATQSTISSQQTSHSIMSGSSAGAVSATSAGSLARRRGWGSMRKRPQSSAGFVNDTASRPQTPVTGFSYYSSHASARPASAVPTEWGTNMADTGGGSVLGGLTTPKARKNGFFKKLVESAKTGTASVRGSIASGQIEQRSPVKNMFANGVSSISGGTSSTAARDMGLGGGSGSAIDWVQVRRDVNRSNSLSRNERLERVERCQMLDQPVIAPVNALMEATEGDEGADGIQVARPSNFQSANLQLVDKAVRFVASLPPMTNAVSLAQGYICRPYRSDVQRLRAIFTWVSERVAWEEDFEDGESDTRRVINTRRGCARETATLVAEMCGAVGIHAEVIPGYLKTPGEPLSIDTLPRPNHWWNAVLVDNHEWRIIDCSLASPTNPKRPNYSSASSQVAESFYFLTRPLEACYTHVPCAFEHQHLCPPVAQDILLTLPCACPPYFKNAIQMLDYDTSLLYIEALELAHISFSIPADIECVATIEVPRYSSDPDGDVFIDSGDTVSKPALAQAEWKAGQKTYTVKTLLPGDEGQGVLKVYAGKRGLMHSIKDNPHPLAFTLPIAHTGQNPPFEFFTRHPTPHAMRHDLYVVQPQCKYLAVNNTFVFAVRQHPSSLSSSCMSPPLGSSISNTSSNPFSPRPGSAMSMISATTSNSNAGGGGYIAQPLSHLHTNGSSSNASTPSSSAGLGLHTPNTLSAAGMASGGSSHKPAKLAIQAPSGKVLRLTKKHEVISNGPSTVGSEGEGGTWETIIKVGERGTWRGLVLADRSARWCVFGEWDCV